MDDSYFEPDLIEQFRLAETDYEVCTHTLMRENTCNRGAKVQGGEINTIGTSGGDSTVSEDCDEETDNDEETDSKAEAYQVRDVSIRKEDEKEARLIDAFISDGCKCSLGPDKQPCSRALSRERIVSTRNNCIEMSTIDFHHS